MSIFAKEYEQYIISGFREESLSTLVPGSDADKYLKILRKINSAEEAMSTELIEEIKQFSLESSNRAASERLNLLYHIKAFDLEQDSEKKTKILEKIRFLYIPESYSSFEKPSHYSMNQQESNEEVKYSHVIDENIFDYETALENIYQATDYHQVEVAINDFNLENLPYYLDMSRFSETVFFEILNNETNSKDLLFKMTNQKNPLEIVKKLAKIAGKSNLKKFPNVENTLKNVFYCMTTEQIELYLSLLPESFNKDAMIGDLINRKFNTELQKVQDNREKHHILMKIYTFLKDKPLTFNSMRCDILLLLLENGILLNTYDKQLFKEYLENPINTDTSQYALSQNKLEKIYEWQSNRQNICNLANKSTNEETTIVSKYLFHFFFFEKSEIDEFSAYLNTNYLKNQYYNAMILKGQDDEASLKHMRHNAYENLVKKVEITIPAFNKDRFGIDEKVVITVDIKNVQTLFIKIFEINTENYYYNKKQVISSAMSLEGLIATYEDTYSFAEKPQKLIRRDFELDKIPNRRGIYIIEMFGNGYSSRAIIKKGGLTLIHRSTVNGKMLYILDEQQKICLGESTGIWIKDEFYKCQSDNGAILIPYQKSTSNEKVILTHEGFAEISTLNLQTENYSLSGSFMLNSESIMMGNVAKVLIKPFLFVNNRSVDIKNLKKAKVTVDLVKVQSEQSIPISNTFEGEAIMNKLLHNEEVEVEFQVPPRLTNIKVTFQAEVMNKSQDIVNSLSIYKEFPVDSNIEHIYAKFFLRRVNDDYFLDLLGKNGEPKSDVQVSLSFNHKIKIFKNQITLQTNKEGEIFLGKLPEVNSFIVSGNYRGNTINAAFNVNHETSLSIPSDLDILEGEEFVLPIGNKSMSTFTFFKMSSLFENKILENLTSTVKVKSYSGDENNNNFKYLLINGLKEGEYLLSWSDTKTKLQLNVHKGQYWDTKNFIVTSTGIIENSENRLGVHLEKFEYEAQSKKLRLKVNSTAGNSRVHLVAYKYLNEEEYTNSKSVKANFEQGRYKNNYSLDKWKNIYLSNRILNEEIQYVLDRKQYERFMGNSLEKPGLLLKRLFVRDTTTNIQNAKEGSQYDDIKPQMLSDKAHPMSMQRPSADLPAFRGRAQQFNATNSIPVSGGINNFHNFLAFSPLIISNLIPDSTGEVSLDLDLSNYSVVNCLLIDSNSVYEEDLFLPFHETKKRDLTLTNPLDTNKSFSEVRKTETLLKSQPFTIHDITSTSFQIIDSIDKYMSFLSLTPNFSSFSNLWKKLSLLLKFGELSQNEQLKFLSEHFSHEVNLFLYFKHNQFFIKNVKSVLKYKMEKTFVDFFLLEDLARLKDFTSPGKFSKLNAFEQCLLIYAFRKIDSELAKTMARRIRTAADENKLSPLEQKRMFNIVMNMKVDETAKELSLDQNMELFGQQPIGINAFMMPMSQPFGSSHSKAMMLKKGKRKAPTRNLFGDEFFDENEVRNLNIRANLAQEGGKSKEYCETHYYGNTSRSFEYLISANGYYADLAEFWANNQDCHLANNFVSANIIYPVMSLPQLVTTLATLDIPLKEVTHQFNRLEGRGLKIVPESNMIVFTNEISATSSDIKSNLMIAQVVNKKTNRQFRTEEEDGMEVEEEKLYLVNEIYQHEAIVTNISNKTITFELLIQIPERSLPVDSSEYTRTVSLTLNKFKTTKVDTFFYFPNCGKFIQYPPTASIEGVVISKIQPMVYDVRESISKSTHATLDDVLESGSKKEILAFLNKAEILKKEDLSKVYWLLKDKDFYYELLKILRLRGIYDKTIWTYSVIHKDVQTLCEVLSGNYVIRNLLGPCVNTSLVKIDEDSNYNLMNHKDYHPILNARVHRVGQEKNNSILNTELKETYQSFVSYLVGLKEIDSKNYLRLCYYLILQDRVDEALKVYGKIDSTTFTENSSLALQYDYISAFLDFSVGFPEFKLARVICQKYKDFPLNYWREMFEEIEDQLLEYDGKESYDDIDQLIDEERKKKQSSKLAAQTEPKLSFTVENKSLQILYTNISSLTVKFYLIDLEILFSRTPFIKQNSDDFSFVQPNFVHSIKVESLTKESLYVYSIPEGFVNSNLFIEVSSSGKKCFDTYFSTPLITNISEAMGEVKVIDEKLTPLTRVYVKCYAKYKDESVKFYKDGYTDLRGKFNYVSLNTNQLKDVKRFALFISHDTLGSTMKECNPPTNISADEVEAFPQTLSDYDNFQHWRQQVKNKFKSSKMK